MKFSITSSCLVKPAKATWKGRMVLAEWDQIGYISHIPTVHIYKPPQDDQIKQSNTTNFVENLKESLSKILVHFYPLAGRLNWVDGGRLELDCNGMGVQFVEAETKTKLDDIGEFLTSSEIQYLAPYIDYESTPLEELPLLYVQITKFQCGGIAFSPAMSHVIVDGRSASYFLAEWAKVARGQPLEVAPFLDKKVLRAGEPPRGTTLPDFVPLLPPPPLIGKTSDREERKKETMVAMLKLTKTQIDSLRNKANEGRDDNRIRPYTRYETITGHIWRCASMARGHKLEQLTALGISVDVRKRMLLPVPQNYFGNSTIDIVASSCCGDLVAKPLSDAASTVREAIDKVTDEYVHSTIDFWKNQKDITPFQDIHALADDEKGPFYGNPNLGVTSWLTLPFHGLDFGWGSDIYMGPATHDIDGDFILLPDNNSDGSVVVRACLQVPHMEVFKKIFYEFITV